MRVRKKLSMIQWRRLHYYEAYQKEEIDQKEYLSRIYPLDMMIDRLEISILQQHISLSWKEQKDDNDP